MRLRTVLFVLALAACHRDSAPAHPNPGEMPPLPPASGTPVGYLIDSSRDLKLRDDQLKQLKDIDASLAARDAEVDTQLRQIEKPDDEPDDPKQNGGKRGRHNNAPGAQIKTTGDAKKLHAIRDSQDRDSLKQAFALLDPDQKTTATKILLDHDVEVPGVKTKKEQTSSDDGTPLPGGEP